MVLETICLALHIRPTLTFSHKVGGDRKEESTKDLRK